jgi:SAM-dependent methyltransferase
MQLMTLTRRLRLDRLFFSLMYRTGRPPWDTGIAPPELVEAVEGPQALPPARALDLGCGTGTNSLYLARHGWRVTGIDFAGPAIQRARAKVRAAGSLAGAETFQRGDVTRLDALGVTGPFELCFDLGCFHGIPMERRQAYVAGVARVAAPGALLLLYAFSPRDIAGRRAGATPDEIRASFTPAFTVERVVEGSDTSRGFTSAWYWLRRAVPNRTGGM